MYLPFLRGKQYELLALRELSTLPLDFSKISPIIEPVKKELKSIATAIKIMDKLGVIVQLVVNPEHGDLKKSNDQIFDFIEQMSSDGHENILPTYLISNERDFTFLKVNGEARDHFNTGYSLIHLNQISSANDLKALVNSTEIRFNIIHVNHLIALRRGYTNGTLGFLSDPFVKQKRNVDYEDLEDEIFSSDYFHYKNEGFSVFSDYLSIGAGFMEGGMLPYAVVIHLTYKDEHSDDIRIKHFLSDSNEDASDTAGKFGEALTKLVTFIDEEHIHTIASEHFRDYHNRGAFPGLGMLKKLSIMHHIELIQSLI
ncbi:sce7725 family protein [Pedobacter polysacchareus]|uniref:sce7725 family protein n=1 Tax=Pedobacter polysacchareus TaxID=2861973 RepID=UPI001C990773|nr:sce7725 family protein [Pedobacter polysacchareus]